MRLPARAGRLVGGLALGTFTGLADLLYVVLAVLLLMIVAPWAGPRRASRRVTVRGAHRLVALERRRLATFLGADTPSPAGDTRTFGYLAARAPVGLRERDVLDLMAQGHTNASIGATLHVSQSAVEKHSNAIFDKLELSRGTAYSRRVLAVLRYLNG